MVKALAAIGKPMLTVLGNHDPRDADSVSFFSKGGTHYQPSLDVNANKRFLEAPTAEFVARLSQGLNRTIQPKFDIQRAPTTSPVGYYYFVNSRGYVFWTTYLGGGVTPISTLLMDGHTPTVNIASQSMVDQVPKALTRDALLSHPIYKEWTQKSLIKPDYVRDLEQQVSREEY